MFGRKKKEVEEPKRPNFKQLNDELNILARDQGIGWKIKWNRIRRKYVIGYKFSYLGRLMVVTRQQEYCEGSVDRTRRFPSTSPKYPKLICNYVSNTGILHQFVFTHEMFDVLD